MYKEAKYGFIEDRMYLEKAAKAFDDFTTKEQQAWIKENPSLAYYLDEKYQGMEGDASNAFHQRVKIEDAIGRAKKQDTAVGALSGGAIGGVVGNLATRGLNTKFGKPGSKGALVGTTAGLIAGANMGANRNQNRFDKTNKSLLDAHAYAATEDERGFNALKKYEREMGYEIE